MAHPQLDGPLALFVNASEKCVGAALNQLVDCAWQPLGFYSKILEDAKTKYITFDRELLAIYKGIKRFRFQLEGHPFTVFMDHKPLTFAFRQKADSW